MPEDWQEGGFGLYIHWPFCQAKCPYCDFNSHVAAEIDHERWQAACLHEIARLGAELPGRSLNSVYFGGGTPSLMEPALVAALLEAIRATWPVSNNFEVTLEANPTSAEANRFRAYREAGVNRASVGLQALDDTDLRRLGRLHDTAEGLAALEMALATFPRVSFDLIYARQNQTLAGWETELSRALTLGAEHLSLYQLTIEPGTAFGARHARGTLPGLPDEDLAADMYFLTQDICEAAGMPAYEISNHAGPGRESSHNLIYWRHGDYAGIGPGAHGRITLQGQHFATRTHLSPARWLEAVERTGSGESARVALTGAEQAGEYLMMGLRMREGISPSRYARLAGSQISNRKINELEDLGLVETGPDNLRATPRGRALLNAVIRELLPEE